MKKRPRNEFNVLAFVLVLSGFLLMLESFGFVKGISNWWPIFLLIIGIGLVMLFNNQKDIGLLWLGSLMIILSIFFFYLNFTSWKQLVKLWPIFIAIFGIPFVISYFFEKSKVLIIVGLFAVLLSASFILIFSLSTKLWPVSLIIAGIFIYLISKYND